MSDRAPAEMIAASNGQSDAVPVPVPGPRARAVPALKSAERVLELDVLRGLSIVMVLIGHTWVHPEVHSFLYFPVEVLNRVGWSGVDVFFVLSGFLVGGLLMREVQKTGTLVPRRFLVRRAFKVWPTFYVYLAVTFAFDVVALQHGPWPARVGAAVARYWPNFLHIQNYVPTDLGWLWSLAVEEHFYLLLPFTLTFILGTRAGAGRATDAVIARRMTACFAVIALGCLGLRGLELARASSLDQAGVTQTHLRIDSLFCGVFLAYLARFHDAALQRLQPYRRWVFLAGLLAWVPFYFDEAHLDQRRLYPFGQIVLYLGAACLVLYAHLASTRVGAQSMVRRAAEWPMQALGWIGVRSYAIYVWHGYFAKPIAHRAVMALKIDGAMPGLAGWAADAVYMAAYIGLGAVMYSIVELPGLRLRQRLAPAMVPSAAP